MADIVFNALRARQAGQDETQGFFDAQARKRAGQALAAGDKSAAADIMYGAGMIDAGLGLEDVQRQDAAAQRSAQLEDRRMKREDAQFAQQEQVQRAAFLKDAATVLRQIPADKRQEAFTGQVGPALKAMGVPDDLLSQVVNHLDDNSLNTFIGQVDNQIKLFNTSSGVVAVDPAALRQNLQDPNASRVIYQDPTYAAYREAQIEATKARAGASTASAEASRARAAKTRAGGGGKVSSAGVTGLPSGFVLD